MSERPPTASSVSPPDSLSSGFTLSEISQCLECLRTIYRYTHCGFLPPLCLLEKTYEFFRKTQMKYKVVQDQEGSHFLDTTKCDVPESRNKASECRNSQTLIRCNVLFFLLKSLVYQPNKGMISDVAQSCSPERISRERSLIAQKVGLRELQFRTRQEVLRNRSSLLWIPSDHFTSEGGFSALRNNLSKYYRDFFHETQAKHQVIRLKLRCACARLISHRQELYETWSFRQAKLESLAYEALKKYDVVKHRQKQLEQKQRLQRLQYLKEHDLDKYWETLKQSKNTRISDIITRMKIFMDNINHQMKMQQKITLGAFQKQLSTRHCQAGEMLDTTTCSMDPQTCGMASFRQLEKQPSILIGGELMSYQLSGLKFLVNLYDNGLSGILADDMGLGKTIQAIAFIAFLKEHRHCLGPHLVIVPLSTLPNWLNEFKRWCPSLDVLEFRGHHPARRSLSRRLKQYTFHVCITTYDWVLRAKSLLSSMYWGLLVVDEGHRLKNIQSKFHITLAEFRSTHRVLLTGTPLQNNLSELWSLLNFLLPNIFSSFIDFEMWFEEPFKNLYPSEKDEIEAALALNEEEKLVIINTLHSIIRPFLLRRVKEDVLNELPQKKECILWVPLSFCQKLAYQCISTKAFRFHEFGGKKLTTKGFRNIMVQLRKVVNHPYLFEEEYPLDENLYRFSAKFEVLDRILPKLLHFKHKTLIFCQMTQIMDLLDDYFEFKGYSRCRLDGTTIVEERRHRVEEFNDPNSSVLIFTLSTRAGGLGLNLQTADTVIIFDSDWNPHQDLQAQARAHRYGQTKEVFVLRLITVSNIEETVLLRARRKLDMDEKIIQAGMFDNTCTEQERQKKLREFLYPKGRATEQSVTLPQELNRLLARNDEEFQFFQDYDRQLFGPALFDKYIQCLEKAKKHNRDSPESLTQKFPLASTVKDSHSSSDKESKEFHGSDRSVDNQYEESSPARDSPNQHFKHEIPVATKTSPDHFDDVLLSRIPSDSELIESHKTYKDALIERKDSQCKMNLCGIDSAPSVMTTEDLLVLSGRLIREDEVPSKWLLPDPEKLKKKDEASTTNTSLDNLPRAGRQFLHPECRHSFFTMTVESLSEAAFNRALRRLESGEVPDFDTALTIEKTRIKKRRQRTSDSFHRYKKKRLPGNTETPNE